MGDDKNSGGVRGQSQALDWRSEILIESESPAARDRPRSRDSPQEKFSCISKEVRKLGERYSVVSYPVWVLEYTLFICFPQSGVGL